MNAQPNHTDALRAKFLHQVTIYRELRRRYRQRKHAGQSVQHLRVALRIAESEAREAKARWQQHRQEAFSLPPCVKKYQVAGHTVDVYTLAMRLRQPEHLAD